MFLGTAKRLSRYYGLYLAAATTGMRAGELLALRWRDIDLVTGRATVTQTYCRLTGDFRPPKTKTSRRPVSLGDTLIDELRRIQQAQQEHKTIFGEDYRGDFDLVFCQPNGAPLCLDNIRSRDFKTVTKEAGLPKTRLHDFRHFHASALLKGGTSIKVVQERLGHANPSITLSVYGHVLPGMQEDAIKQFEDRLFRPPDAQS